MRCLLGAAIAAGGERREGGGGGLPSLRPHHPPPGSAARLLCTLAPALSAGRAAAPRAQHGGESRFAAAAAGRAAGCPGGRGCSGQGWRWCRALGSEGASSSFQRRAAVLPPGLTLKNKLPFSRESFTRCILD